MQETFGRTAQVLFLRRMSNLTEWACRFAGKRPQHQIGSADFFPSA
jgi:hypothetical protein